MKKSRVKIYTWEKVGEHFLFRQNVLKIPVFRRLVLYFESETVLKFYNLEAWGLVHQEKG